MRKCPKCKGPKFNKNGHTPAGKQRYLCMECGYSTTDPKAEARDQSGKKQKKIKATPKFTRALGGVKRLVVTAAQNATPAHTGFLTALEGYCQAHDAELIVIPIRYKNPTSRWTRSQANEDQWDGRLEPYLYNQRKKLNANLVLLGDIKTQPTATRPLSGFEGITHGESGILAHTKLQLKSIPAPQSAMPKIMTTTGAVTLPNYTDSKAGKLGEFHHSFAAAAVEIQGSKFHIRQLRACEDGSFIDAADNMEYRADGTVRPAGRAKALVLGDLHWRTRDPKAVNATFGKGGMVEVMDPEVIVLHDLLDGVSVNHHERANPFSRLATRELDFHLVEKEVRDTIEGVSKLLDGRQAIVVPSNHDRFLSRWVTENDWRDDVENAAFYLETAKAMVDSVKWTPQGPSVTDPFAYWIRQWGPDNLTPLRLDEPYTIDGIELNMHGDLGPNGARGTVNNLSRLGVKVMSGHTHSPAIEEGHDKVGTMSYLRASYAKGPSSWLQTNGTILANGKQTLLNIIDGKWRMQ